MTARTSLTAFYLLALLLIVSAGLIYPAHPFQCGTFQIADTRYFWCFIKP